MDWETRINRLKVKTHKARINKLIKTIEKEGFSKETYEDNSRHLISNAINYYVLLEKYNELNKKYKALRSIEKYILNCKESEV